MRLTRLLALLVYLSGAPLIALAQFEAQFDPANGVLPSPINLLFLGSTDGTLNIPNPDGLTTIDALNALDGFSTVAPLTATFSAAVDPAAVRAGDTVRVFEVGLANPFAPTEETARKAPFAVTGIITELAGGSDFSAGLLAADPEQRTLEITPLRPLKPKTGYMVVLTDGILAAADGAKSRPDLTYIFTRYRKQPLVDEVGRSRFRVFSDAQAQNLEAIRRIVTSQEAAAEQVMPPGNIVLSWSFMTQSIDDVLQQVRAAAAPRPLQLVATGLNTAAVGTGTGLADIYAGTLQIPYYSTAPTLVPAVVLSSVWAGVNGTPLTRYNPTPVPTQTLTIPVLATLPSQQTQPEGGWPAVIFQHVISLDRTVMLLIADSLAARGFAVFAIDLPLHGITDTDHPFYSDGRERTFNVDLVDNANLAPGADGLIDPSGTHVISLSSPLTTRDNSRQGISDLMHLTASIPTLDLDSDGQTDFDARQMYFIGMSLGGIVGTPFLGINSGALRAAALTVAAGGLARLFEASPIFGPIFRAGLAAVGLLPDTPQYEAFWRLAQQAWDPIDPINYAAAAADGLPLLMHEVIGDATVVNSVAGAPLSGTEALAAIMELQDVAASAADENGLRVFVRFAEGDHGTYLTPRASAAATLEMREQIAGFLATDGTALTVGDGSVLVSVPEL